MGVEHDGVRWFKDSEGRRLGVERTDHGLRFLFPDGTKKDITAEDAPRIVSMLKDGVAFAQITGAEGFSVSPEDF